MSLWVSCHTGDISKFIYGKLSTDNMTNVNNFMGECLAESNIIRIFVMVLCTLGGRKV